MALVRQCLWTRPAQPRAADPPADAGPVAPHHPAEHGRAGHDHGKRRHPRLFRYDQLLIMSSITNPMTSKLVLFLFVPFGLFVPPTHPSKESVHPLFLYSSSTQTQQTLSEHSHQHAIPLPILLRTFPHTSPHIYRSYHTCCGENDTE